MWYLSSMTFDLPQKPTMTAISTNDIGRLTRVFGKLEANVLGKARARCILPWCIFLPIDLKYQ